MTKKNRSFKKIKNNDIKKYEVNTAITKEFDENHSMTFMVDVDKSIDNFDA